MSYAPPMTCAEPFDLDSQLCQASGGTFEEPDDLNDLTWSY